MQEFSEGTIIEDKMKKEYPKNFAICPECLTPLTRLKSCDSRKYESEFEYNCLECGDTFLLTIS